jgi:very-short-patch-repair endonuclease
LLWSYLRNRHLGGFKFRRQEPFGSYVLDFYCHERALVVEIDGVGHYLANGLVRDEDRTRRLEALGLRVLRFTNADVLGNLEGVIQTILLELER